MATSSSVTSALSTEDNTQAGNYTDNQNDGHFYSLSTGIGSTVSSLLVDSNQTNVHQPILSSEAGSNIAITYGVDWSDSARPSSHCWFPFISNDASIVQACEYVSCTEQKSALHSTILQCGSCGLTIHSHHLNDLKVINATLIPLCRPSFIDNTTSGNSLLNRKDNPSKHDEHFWSHVPVLSKPCTHCRRTSVATTLFDSGFNQLSIVSPSEILDEVTSIISSISENFSSKMSKSSPGLVCLWCSQNYHQSCWEQLATDDNRNQCDYGIFRNIIVRPQWLTRSNESSTGFKAIVSLYSINNNSKSNSFPYTPILVFINKRSGGQVGEKIYQQLLRKLNPRQIFLLENNDTITDALKIYSSLPNIRICVFGGDGTVGWILGHLAEFYPSVNNPPVAICPLGTGNDLSRVLSWGEQYEPDRLFQTLLQIPLAQIVALDRWQVQLEKLDASAVVSSKPLYRETGTSLDQIFKTLFDDPKFTRESNRAGLENYQKLPNTHFINYMSFGLDAAITLEFHDERNRDPSKFSSPLKNKLMYLNESWKYFDDFARASMWDLSPYIRLICDGQNLTDALRNCHTLVVLNIPGYAAGTNPWGTSLIERLTINNINQSSISQVDSDSVDCVTNELETSSITTTASPGNFKRQDFGDRKIEVVGLSTTHMAAIHVGFAGYRIAQCHQLRIEFCCPMTAQMDGEPFHLPASVAVNISHAGQVLVTRNKTK